MDQALTSPARIPATQHQRPSNLVASTLRAVGKTVSKVWRHISCPVRRGIIVVGILYVLCVESAYFFMLRDTRYHHRVKSRTKGKCEGVAY